MERGSAQESELPPAHYQQIMRYLREKRESDPSFTDVMTLAEITAESMQTFVETMDSALYRELREIARYIETMKMEIGVFQVNDLKEQRIPAAGQELDAVVRSTEDATNTIMQCAEELMAADFDDLDAYREFVTDRVLRIFEACSFQDLTGQRVGKVVETLKTIETRVQRFAKAVNARDVQSYSDAAEELRAKRARDLMLNGPQLSGKGNDQDSVDDLFNKV